MTVEGLLSRFEMHAYKTITCWYNHVWHVLIGYTCIFVTPLKTYLTFSPKMSKKSVIFGQFQPISIVKNLCQHAHHLFSRSRATDFLVGRCFRCWHCSGLPTGIITITERSHIESRDKQSEKWDGKQPKWESYWELNIYKQSLY